MKMSTRHALSLAVLLLAGSVAAVGAPSGAVPTKIVQIADLDLTSAAGAETLYNRIKSAARTVCRDADRYAMQACRARAVEAAVSKVGNPLLSSLHRSTTGRVAEVVRR